MMPSPRPALAFHTFGCRLNQAESEHWQSLLAAQGFPITDREHADVFCVHSCAVTEPAVKEVTRLLRTVQQHNPALRLILSGCAATLVTDVDVDLRIPHDEKANWVAHVLRFLQTFTVTATQSPPARPHRTRASLILQDGCDHFCAYCIVPHVRGAPVSEPAEQILQRAQALFAQGYEEIVLTGCHLALYRDPAHGIDFIELLRRLCDVPGEGRFRIGSLEPCILDDSALIRLIRDSGGRICSFLHFPMQSADDHVLQLMRRRYTQADLRAVLDTVCAELPGCGLSADWIAGHPGETPEAAHCTADFIAAYPFTGAHVFPYSKRVGTPAATFPNQVPPNEILRRAKLLRETAERQRHQQLRMAVGKPLEVIPERLRDGYRLGWSAERFLCRLPGSVIRGKRLRVTPTALEGDTLIVPQLQD